MERESILGAVLLVVAAGGCSGSGNAAIVGDWFECESISCSALKSLGVRYRSDGTWVVLSGLGATLEDNEKYCLKHGGAHSQGAYTWDGKVLKTTSTGGTKDEVGFEVTGSDATKTNLATSSYVKLKEISDPRASGFCGTGTGSDAGADSSPVDADTADGIPPVVLDTTPYFPDF